jgi:hypothetical protein
MMDVEDPPLLNTVCWRRRERDDTRFSSRRPLIFQTSPVGSARPDRTVRLRAVIFAHFIVWESGGWIRKCVWRGFHARLEGGRRGARL